MNTFEEGMIDTIIDDFDYCPICNRVLTSYERNIFYGDFLCEECQKKFSLSKSKIELSIYCRVGSLFYNFYDYCVSYKKLLFFFYTNEIINHQEQEKVFDKMFNFFKKKKQLRMMKRIGAFLIGM